jgi:hypothetical protein
MHTVEIYFSEETICSLAFQSGSKRMLFTRCLWSVIAKGKKEAKGETRKKRKGRKQSKRRREGKGRT